jgi:hypothetical protein
MKYTRIGLWAAAAAVAVAVTTTAVGTVTGALGREVLTEDGVTDALAAAQAQAAANAAPAPLGRSEMPAAADADAVYRAGDEKLLQTIGGDIVASCDKNVMTVHSIAPKPGYQIMMMTVDRDAVTVGDTKWFALPPTPRQAHPIRITIGKGGGLSLVFDKDSSEVSNKVTLSCVDGEPTAKESEVVKNYGAGKG